MRFARGRRGARRGLRSRPGEQYSASPRLRVKCRCSRCCSCELQLTRSRGAWGGPSKTAVARPAECRPQRLFFLGVLDGEERCAALCLSVGSGAIPRLALLAWNDLPSAVLCASAWKHITRGACTRNTLREEHPLLGTSERCGKIDRNQRIDRNRSRGGLMSFAARSLVTAALFGAHGVQAQTPATPQGAPAQSAPAQTAPPSVVARATPRFRCGRIRAVSRACYRGP